MTVALFWKSLTFCLLEEKFALSLAFGILGTLHAALLGAHTWAQSDSTTNVNENDKSTSQDVSSWTPLKIAFTSHFIIGAPFGIISFFWPHGLYKIFMSIISMDDTSTPSELFGIRFWGSQIIINVGLAYCASNGTLSKISQFAFAQSMVLNFSFITALYLWEMEHLNLLYNFGGTPIFVFFLVLYLNAVFGSGANRNEGEAIKSK